MGKGHRPTLARTAFVTHRALEFFTESELTTQMGYGRQLWPLIIVKELIDNSLDGCETGAVAPEISISLEADAISVTDNGPGIAAKVIDKSLDYHVRISDKRHYISPTRGQRGNALKCVWAAPFVANGRHSGLVEVETRGLHHRVEVNVDRIKQLPVIEHTTSDSVENGTLVKVYWNGIASCEVAAPGFFYRCSLKTALEWLVRNYAAFNPHATFHFGDLHLKASDPKWTKWRTDQPSSAHWYRISDLRNLIAAYITAGDRPVRDFIAEFTGLRGTQIRQKVLTEADISGSRLSDFVINGDVDQLKVDRLLAAMRANSKPVKPERLGIIGRDRLEKTLIAAGGANCKYWKQITFDEEGLPLVIEIAFGVRSEADGQERMIGLNWSPVLKIPSVHISEALNSCRVEFTDDVLLIIHLAQPRWAFSDHGKGALSE
jgi:DNA topoisomerase VI subunit B